MNVFKMEIFYYLGRKYQQSGMNETCIRQSKFVFMSANVSNWMFIITKTGSQKIKFSPALISTSKKSTSLANLFHYDEVLEDDH